MEESSHSTPSPMSSAASSQDSLHRNAATLHYQHQLHHQNPYGNLMTNTLPANAHLGLVNKKKGVKSTLGRIFGKKDKGDRHHQMKALAASAAASGNRSPAGMSLGSPQVIDFFEGLKNLVNLAECLVTLKILIFNDFDVFHD